MTGYVQIQRPGELWAALHPGRRKARNSILHAAKSGYITGARKNLHKHHCFNGSRREESERWGCWVWLHEDMHNMTEQGVHFNPALDKQIKAACQEEFEALYGHEVFMAVFGKNYLEPGRVTFRPAGKPVDITCDDWDTTSFAVTDGPALPF